MIRRWDAPDEQLLRRILASPPPPLDSTPLRARAVFFREIYFDTSGGDLRQRGARCRLRFVVDGTTSLTVWLAGGPRVRSRLPSLALSQGDAIATLAGDSPAAARLRALVDPTRLESWIERDVERIWRTRRVPLFRVPLYDLAGDVVTVRRQELTARFAELAVCPRPWGGGAAGRLASELEAAFPLRPAGNDPVLRAQAALDGVEGEAIGRELRGEREVAVIAVEHGRIGLCRSGGTDLRVPVQRGSGEEACRAALREIVGTGEGQLRLLGVVPRSGDRVPLEVWTARRLHRNPNNGDRLQWFDPAELIARVGSPMLRDPGTLAALTVAARSPLLPEWSGAPFDTGETPIDRPPTTREDVARASRVTLSELRALVRSDEVKDPARQSPDQFLNPELSWLEFNSRVLTLAEDQATPAAARLRFLGIFSTNLDQFVMTRIGALKQLVAAGHNARSPHGGGLRPQETLDAIAIRLRPLLERQYRAFHSLEPLLGLQQWEQLSEDERAELRARCADEVLPFVSPKALTRAPGHPFPLVGDRRLSLLVAMRNAAGSPMHYAVIDISPELPRVLAISSGRKQILIETVLRKNLDLLFPGRIIAGAHVFRLTRSGDLQLDETTTANFLQAIEEELAHRQQQPVLRVELEAATPPALRDLLQRELRFEESDRDSTLSPADVYSVEGPVDLGGLQGAAAAAHLPDYPPFTPADVFAGDRPIADQLDARDKLVYHPRDSFESSVERFISEAANDPDVQGIKLTLYRLGASSPIAEALRRAATAGKDVSVVVELKARFEEARNITWARSLERDGIHVVTGLVSLKTHAKIALVVRRKEGRVQRYAHIGTGNYNPATARTYTDLGLFTAHPGITSDVHTLFNELTGSTQAPQVRLRHLLVAPTDLLDRLLALIDREASHARAGRPGRIRAKLNALSDSTVIQALYKASQDGVAIDLVVRGICTLRPGIPGISERIRVVSILGRFLEHARIYHFANGGDDEYYMGSADWRPRNLRRRVEVMCPVYDPAARSTLDMLLTQEMVMTGAWRLRPDGGYDRT